MVIEVKDSFPNLKQSMDKYWLKILKFYEVINKDLFGNYFCLLVVCIFILIFGNFFLGKKENVNIMFYKLLLINL